MVAGMIRPELNRVAAKVRARLQAGEALTWRDVWAMAPEASRTWAHDTLRKLYAKGEIHVVAWTRSQQGRPMPTYKWGPGMDARRPPSMTNAEKCARWRDAHPEKIALARKRYVFKRRKSPFLDPIAAALLGYTRRGTGWVKKSTTSPSQDATQ